MNKPIAYSYIRMSTDIQLKGDSLRRQEELSKRYAEENDLELDVDFKLQDIGISAFKGDNLVNGALGKFLDAIKFGEIPKGSFLLVESLDRLSRQKIGDALQLFLSITNSGVNIVTLNDEQVYKAGIDDFSQLIVSIAIMSRAYEESETKSKRLSEAWNNKRNNAGKKILTKICPLWLKPNKELSSFETIPERVKIVERIFDDASNGQGSGYITRALNRDNIPPFGRSKGWQESYVTKILKNRSVLGEYQPNRKVDGKRTPIGDVIKDYYPPIIEENMFLKVQADRKLRRVSGAGRKGKKQRNLFTHIAKCYYCGSSMRFINKGIGPKGGTYLKCSSAVGGMDCITKSWRYKDFETSFFSFVREFNLKEVIERTSVRTEQAKIRVQLSIENERLEGFKLQRDRVMSLLLDGQSATEYVSNKISELSLEIDSVKETISDLNVILKNVNLDTVLPSINEEDPANIIRDFNKLEDVEKRFLVSAKLKEFIKEINISADGIKPNFEGTKLMVEEGSDDPEDASKIIDVLKDTYFNSPLSNPHFSILFYDGTERLVIPSPDDPTILLRKVEVKDKQGYVEDGSGNILFPKK